MLHFPLHPHLGWGAVSQAPCLPMVRAHPRVGRQRGPPAAGCTADSMSPHALPARGLPSKAPPHQAGATRPSTGHCEGEAGCRRGAKHPPTLTQLLFLQHLEHFEEQEGQQTTNLCQSGGSFQL